MLIHGSCHCGNLRFALRWEPDPQSIPARACGCSFCVKHGAAWTAHPQARLEIRIADPGAVSRHEFGTRTAQFLVCSRCGGVPAAVSTIDGRDYAVVNVNTFDGIDRALLRPLPVSFDGEGTGERLERRKRNWIGSVETAGSGPR